MSINGRGGERLRGSSSEKTDSRASHCGGGGGGGGATSYFWFLGSARSRTGMWGTGMVGIMLATWKNLKSLGIYVAEFRRF